MRSKVDYKRILRYVWIIYAAFSIVIVLYLVDMLICKDIMKVSNRYLLNDGWNITINDMHYDNVSLEEFIFDSVNKNDMIVMENTIPSEHIYKEAVLTVFSRHSTMSVYVDNELKYEYGYERHLNNKATGCGYQFINFFDEYKGKNLRIEYIVTENSAFSKFDAPWICEWENAYRYIVTENRIPLILGVFLMVLGVIMTCILAFSVTVSIKYSNVLLLALFSICVGLWTLCYYKVMLIFSIPVYSVSLMEHMSLFIAPIPLIAYMRTYVREINSKCVNTIHDVLFFGQLGLTVVSIALHYFDIVHGAAIIKLFHIMFAFHMVFFVYIISHHMKNNKTLSKIITIGMMVVAGCLFYELIKYLIPRYTGYNIPEIKGVASAGIVVFIGILVMDLYLKVTKNMMKEHEKELLIKRAFTDELTQIHNRAYCTDYMEKISKTNNSSYTIINFDLNGLKQMNDTYGHAKGDELICAAATVIDKSFSSDGAVGRMGGDEFIAIIKTANVIRIEQLIEKFKSNIDDANKEKPELGLSISYGYATNREVESADYEKIYHIADERMYAYKQQVKKDMKA